MITKMTKYSFILLSADKEQFLNNLQELGVVDITRSVKPLSSICCWAACLKKSSIILFSLSVIAILF